MVVPVTGFKLYYWFAYRKNDKKLRAAPSMERYRPVLDRPYGSNRQQVYDLYLAEEDKRKRILLIDIHGGYYVRGRHRDAYPFAIPFLEEGFDFLSMEYRLCGKGVETRDQLQDVALCLRELFSHLKELGLEGERRFFLTGDSAGGHLALCAAEALNEPKLGMDLSGVQLDGVLLNCPSYNYESYRESGFDSEKMKRWYLGKRYAEPGYLEAISPRTYLKSLQIPVFVSTCKNDFLHSGVKLLEQELIQFGKEYVFLDLPDEDPKVSHVHNVTDPDLPASELVNNAMMEFMLKYAEKKKIRKRAVL